MKIYYRRGYKYQLARPAVFDLSSYAVADWTGAETGNKWVTISSDGLLRIAAGYAWDGSSGPARDTRQCMRASLAHDALYQLLRIGALPLAARVVADEIYRDLLREDGMWSLRAWWRWWALDRFGRAAAEGPDRAVLVAP